MRAEASPEAILRLAAVELAAFLKTQLPPLSPDWWTKHVIERLSFQQQRVAAERKFSAIEDLDLASLLRVLDQNWIELSGRLSLPREGRSWVKELQAARNRSAHIAAKGMPQEDMYRDADTLGRLMSAIGASARTLHVIEEAKAEGLRHLTRSTESPRPAPEHTSTSEPPIIVAEKGSPTPAASRGSAGQVDLSSEAFRVALTRTIGEAERALMPFVEINSGELHRSLGGYPGRSHRMKTCCDVMRVEMRSGDELISAPTKGYGASLTIRYKLPR